MSLHNQFLLKNEHRLLGLMLFFLLAAIHAGSNDTVAQSFLIAHFGFFLLWQPVVNQQSAFNNIQLIILGSFFHGNIKVYDWLIKNLFSIQFNSLIDILDEGISFELLF